MTTQKRLKNLRAMTGMSQHKFAEYFKIPHSTLIHWEHGTNKPPIYVLDMIEKLIQYENLTKKEE